MSGPQKQKPRRVSSPGFNMWNDRLGSATGAATPSSHARGYVVVKLQIAVRGMVVPFCGKNRLIEIGEA